MNKAMDELKKEIIVNPDLVDKLLDSKFNWDTVMEGAKDLNIDLTASDIEEYFEENYPPTSPDSATTYYIQDESIGEFRELASHELSGVSGGTTAVAAVLLVYVAAVVFQAAAIATVVMAGTAVAIGGWALVAVGISVAGPIGPNEVLTES